MDSYRSAAFQGGKITKDTDEFNVMVQRSRCEDLQNNEETKKMNHHIKPKKK